MGTGRRGRAIVLFLPLFKWSLPSLSFLSVKCLPFGTLPSFSIIKTFCMSEEVEAEERRQIEGALNSISQPSEVPALISRQRM